MRLPRSRSSSRSRWTASMPSCTSLDILLDGLEQLRTLHITYSPPSNTAAKSYQVHPLKLFEHRGGLYIFVKLPKHDIIRILAVDRIKGAKLLDTVFAYPQDFDAEA